MEYQLALEQPYMDADILPALADTRLLAERVFPIMHRGLIDAFADIFEAEGSPHWAPLAPYTLAEREYLGFDPGPILFREGLLAWSFLHAHHPLHVYEVELSEHESTMRVGSIDRRAQPLAEGDPATNLPARPIVPDGTVVFEEMEANVYYVAEALYG